MDLKPPTTIDLSRYYASPAHACFELGVSQHTLTKWIREGKVKSLKLGAKFRLIERPEAPAPKDAA